MNHPRFEPNQFPLEPGLRLLEASAGTGKTFALAHLVLRLLVKGPNPLQVEQLLVVTFTEAAAGTEGSHRPPLATGPSPAARSRR